MSQSNSHSLDKQNTISDMNTIEVKNTTMPFFRLKPISKSNRAIIKHIGYYNPDEEKLGDELVELPKPLHPNWDCIGYRHAIPIQNINDHILTGWIYHCNIVGSFIVNSLRYPLMYLSVIYDKATLSGSLFQLCLSIDMDVDIKKEIKERKLNREKFRNARYVNLNFSGTWKMQIDCDIELNENYDNILKNILTNEENYNFHNYINNDTNNTNNTNNTININNTNNTNSIAELKELYINEYIKSERSFYDDLVKGYNYNFISIDATTDYFTDLCSNKKFLNFIKIALECRQIQRRQKFGIDEEIFNYKIPEKITNMNTIKNDLLESNEIIFD